MSTALRTLEGYWGPVSRGRSKVAAVLLAAAVVAATASPAIAASSAWDPDDVEGKLDLRWVGVYRQDPDTVRLFLLARMGAGPGLDAASAGAANPRRHRYLGLRWRPSRIWLHPHQPTGWMGD